MLLSALRELALLTSPDVLPFQTAIAPTAAFIFASQRDVLEVRIFLSLPELILRLEVSPTKHSGNSLIRSGAYFPLAPTRPHHTIRPLIVLARLDSKTPTSKMATPCLPFPKLHKHSPTSNRPHLPNHPASSTIATTWTPPSPSLVIPHHISIRPLLTRAKEAIGGELENESERGHPSRAGAMPTYVYWKEGSHTRREGSW